jgi:hypothetical protein
MLILLEMFLQITFLKTSSLFLPRAFPFEIDFFQLKIHFVSLINDSRWLISTLIGN